jgi:hypothetical protein
MDDVIFGGVQAATWNHLTETLRQADVPGDPEEQHLQGRTADPQGRLDPHLRCDGSSSTSPVEAMELPLDKMGKTKNNAEFLNAMQKG